MEWHDHRTVSAIVRGGLQDPRKMNRMDVVHALDKLDASLDPTVGKVFAVIFGAEIEEVKYNETQLGPTEWRRARKVVETVLAALDMAEKVSPHRLALADDLEDEERRRQ